MTPAEIWRPVVGWEGRYEVSDHGRVRSLPRYDSRGHFRLGRMIRPAVSDKSGHTAVNLYRDGTPTRRTVHQLVGAAFVGPRPPGQVTRHKNGEAWNNHVDNLLYGTQAENLADARRMGRLPTKKETPA